MTSTMWNLLYLAEGSSSSRH